MRAPPHSSTIGSMFLHPIVHLEIARQRNQELRADAERRPIAKGCDRAGRTLLKRQGRSSTWRASETGTPHLTQASKTHWRVEQVLSAANHFGHRETDGITVDL